jgi:plasmid maintenance system antidote protein VapI
LRFPSNSGHALSRSETAPRPTHTCPTCRLRINEVVQGQRSIDAGTAFRLGRYFGMSPQFWLNRQSSDDLESSGMESGEQIDNGILNQSIDLFV